VRCAGLERTPIHRINGKNTIPDVAASEKNANEKTQYCCLRSWCNITIKLYQRNVPRDRGTQSSGKSKIKKTPVEVRSKKNMNMYLHLFRSYTTQAKRRIKSRKNKQNIAISLIYY